MTRLVRIVNRLNIGGPTFNVAYLTKYLAPKYQTDLIAGRLDEGEKSSAYILDELGLAPIYAEHLCKEIRPGEDWRGYQELKRLIAERNPTIVHTHASKSGALGRLAAFACKVPIVVHTYHGNYFNNTYFSPQKTQFLMAIDRYLARRSSAIVAISQLQYDDLVTHYRIAPAHKVHVVPNGFDLDRFQQQMDAKRADFRAKYHIAPDTVVVGHVGRFVPIKNHALFLEAYAQLRKQQTGPMVAVLVGDGELRADVEAQIRALGLRMQQGDVPPADGPADVILTSWITQIDWALAGMDVVALSSLNEGTPVSLIEAQAAQRPVVSTDVGGVRDTIRHDVSGLAVPNQDAAAFAKAMGQLVQNEDLRHQMGQAGLEFVGKKYSYQRLVADMDALYTELLAQHAAKKRR
jgi:glycosyltransferase involved in cell wall biosynthesis